MKTKTPLIMTCLVFLMPVLALTGCGNSQPEAWPTVTATETATTNAASKKDIQEALNQYNGYWIALRDASRLPEQERRKRLEQYVTGKKVEESLDIVNEDANEGINVYGQIIMRPKIISTTKNQINFYDCQDTSSLKIVDRDGNPISDEVTTIPWKVEAIKESGVWKISYSTDEEEEACQGK